MASNNDIINYGNLDRFKKNLDEVLDNKQDKLTAGTNVTISNNVISATDTTYAVATYDTAGLIKLGSNTAATQAVETVSSTSGRQYAVQVDSNGRASVNVPWSDTTYTAGTGINISSGSISVDSSTVAMQSDLPVGTEEVNFNDNSTTATSATLENIVVGNSSDGYTRYSVVSGMSNPMTTAGDIIYGGSSGTPTRLAKGTAGQVLTMNSGATAPEWADVIPTVVISSSQVIPNSDPLQVQLTQAQWDVFANNFQVIIDGSDLGVGSNLFYKGVWDSVNGYYFSSKTYGVGINHYDIEFDDSTLLATMVLRNTYDLEIGYAQITSGSSSNAGKILKMDSNGYGMLSNGLPYIDCTGVSPTYPSTANTDGLIIVLCSSEPSTKYAGYIYLVS